MTLALYSFFSAVTIGFALVVVFAKEVFRAAFALLGALCGIAGLLALMGATTVAALQVLIYVGGVFVLFLFAILVTERPDANLFRRSPVAVVVATVLAVLVLVLMLSVAGSWHLTNTQPTDAMNARALGRSLISDNLLTFEAVGVLLLIGLAAAVIVVRKELER